MKNLLNFRNTVLPIIVCLIIFTSCSQEETEEFAAEEFTTEELVMANPQTRVNENTVTNRFGDVELEVSNILPDTAEYRQQLEILTKEGARVIRGVNAIKSVDFFENTTYYFKSKRDVTFGVVYMEGEFQGVVRLTETFNINGKATIILSNLKGDRTLDVRDRDDVAAKFSGSYPQCVSDSVEFAYDGCGGGFWGYVCGVPWSMGSVIYCVGETAACYFFCD